MFPSKTIPALVALLLVIASTRAERNLTIDDTDPRVVYQPPGVWDFLGNTAVTQDRWNKTTHFTSELGATASLTFTGAIRVYYVGYGIKEMPPPALVPITLQPQHGSAITVQSESYRPEGAQAQIILFTSDTLEPTETYTITATKTNATLVHGLNIDSFILTQLDDLTAGTPSSGSAPSSFPVVSLSVPDTTITASVSSTQPSSTTNAGTNDVNRSHLATTAAIAGGVIGGIAMGIIIAFTFFRWWSKRNQQRQDVSRLPIPLSIPLSSDDTNPRPAGPPPRSSKYGYGRVSTSTQGTTPGMTGNQSVPSTLVSTRQHSVPTTASTVPRRSGRTETSQAQQSLASMGNSPPSSVVSVHSPPPHIAPPSIGDRDSTPPAYSRD